MKEKNIFFKSTLILIIGGIFTKILSFFVRIIYTRLVGAEIISLYSIVMPTYSLIITIATFALPITISKLVAEGKNNNQKLIFNSITLIMSINFIVSILLIIFAKFLANNLLHEPRTYLIIIAMALSYPIISISAIIKGYFYGKQNMIPNAVSNIIEESVRLLLVIFMVPYILKRSTILAASSLFIFTFIEELISIFVNLLFLPKNIKIEKENLVIDKYTMNSIVSISLPTLSSRLIGNIAYFFEPIILKNLLLYKGYTNNYILLEYGAYNSYAIPILTMPSFFITAISSALIPEISKLYLKKEKNLVLKRIRQAIFFSLVIGLPYSIFLIIFSKPILTFLYNTQQGLYYILILAPIFPLFYIESILMSFLQAIDKAKTTMKITIIGIIIKTISLIILSLLNIGMYSLIISEIIDILVVVILNIKYTIRYLREK